ncbi:hypothetical protein SAMCFNEI73_Ch3400 [Sinorhizobium americanum]|uniref:Uncharacterized protein n=1 Tax=Sinorhizobium americanum TaxID=194963 RepID=A0A1L3LRE5_9HYPH|nr:hypothetical protein SAMCFNEI73_Ch3400 [Sinorhizobium americanum]
MPIKSHKDIFMSTCDSITILARGKSGRNKKDRMIGAPAASLHGSSGRSVFRAGSNGSTD